MDDRYGASHASAIEMAQSLASGDENQIQTNQPDIHSLFAALTNQVATAFGAMQRALPDISENGELVADQ